MMIQATQLQKLEQKLLEHGFEVFREGVNKDHALETNATPAILDKLCEELEAHWVEVIDYILDEDEYAFYCGYETRW